MIAPAARWSALPGNVRGALWVLLASLAFSLMAVCIRLVGERLGVWEIVALRTVVALALLAPAAVRAGPGVLRTERPGAHLLRALLGMCGLVSIFFALTHLQLALAITLGFTRVLFVIVLAVLFLGERIRWRRTLATLAGFGGVLVCVWPDSGGFDPWTLAALSGALFAASVSTMIKRLTRTEAPLTIMLWTYIVMGTAAIAPAWWTWRTPTAMDLALIALMGLVSAIGQSAMVLGLRAGEVTAVTPFEYSRLIYSVALGFALFAEIPSANTWAGAAIIVASTLYIALREARLQREPAPSP